MGEKYIGCPPQGVIPESVGYGKIGSAMGSQFIPLVDATPTSLDASGTSIPGKTGGPKQR